MTRIAISGLGSHAVKGHLAQLKTLADVEIAGVVEPNDANFAKAQTSQQVSLHRYENYEALLADPRVDGVIIATPDHLHLPQMQAAVAAGKHVYCEKPLITNAAELDLLKDVFRTASTKGLVVTSCHPRRFDPPYVWLKDNLAELTEQLGKPLALTLDFSYDKPTAGKENLHGGSLMQDHANHEIDYTHWLFGLAPTQAFLKIDSAERYEMSGSRDDGVTFEFVGTRRLHSQINPETIRLRFERGDVMIDTYEQPNSYMRRHDAIVHTANGRSSFSISPIAPGVTNYNLRNTAVNRAFVDAIEARCANYLKPEEMLANSLFSVGMNMQGNRIFYFRPQQAQL